MKKLVLFAVAALCAASSYAQLSYDEFGVKRKIMVAENDVKDPKKSTRGITWAQRGDAYFQAAEAPIKGLYKGMIQADIDRICGTPSEKRAESIGDVSYEVWVYNNYELYRKDGKNVTFWKQKIKILDDGLEKAFESYKKALELEPKLEEKLKPSVQKIIDAYKQESDLAMAVSDYGRARNAFIKIYEYSQIPVINKVDTMMAYNAGYLSIPIKDFDTSLKYLGEAKRLDCERNGELYKLLNYAYIGKKDPKSAVEALKEGITKYPSNTELIELLLGVYSSTGGDPAEIVPIVKGALDKDPNSFTLSFGLGIIYDKLGDSNNAAIQFEAASKINPNDFGALYNLGVAKVRMGEALVPALNEIPFSDQVRYQAKLKELNDFYRSSLEPLEKAHAINPTERSTVDLLKTFYFRFRDESPEMMAKYEKYNALLNTL